MVYLTDRAPILVKPPGAKCPFPVNRDTSLAELANRGLETVAQEMYDGDDVRFMGKTRLEATLLSLAFDAPHDPQARTEFLDRAMGKPKQRVDNMNLNVNLVGYLDQFIAEEEEGREGMFK